MPRLARLDAPGVLHHVMGRGIEKRDIFFSDGDRIDFLERLSSLANEGAMAIYAWTLMPNHFHLLCKTKNQPLASSMRRILTGYAVSFNKRHSRHGHLFQNRYKSIVCQEEHYLKELVRYIHLNLLRGGIVGSFDELNRSPWSGHSAIMENVRRTWQDTDYVLSFFRNNDSSRDEYCEYVLKGIRLGRRKELVGGGLVRSLGGWSEVRSLRRKGNRQSYDQRILGDGDFVQEVISGIDNTIKQNLRLSGQRIAIETLAKKVCNKYDVSAGELCAGTRRHTGVVARQALSWIAVRELGYSGADVARYLGVTNSCITRFIASGQKPDVDDLVARL